MKKIFLVLPMLVLLAAGCNASQEATVDTNTSLNQSSDQITDNTSPMVYSNTEFGFRMTLNQDWNGYKVVRTGSTNALDKKVALTFNVPTVAAEYSAQGYPALTLLVYKKSDYDAALKVVSDGLPLKNFPIVAQSDGYVIIRGAGSNASQPSDVKVDNNAAAQVAQTITFSN